MHHQRLFGELLAASAAMPRPTAQRNHAQHVGRMGLEMPRFIPHFDA